MSSKIASLSFVLVAAAAFAAGCESGYEDEDGPLEFGGGGPGGSGQGGEGAGFGACPSAPDCDCLGGRTVENDCGGFECICPTLCSTDAECAGGFCLHPDGACTESSGYCTTKEAEAENAALCGDQPAVCGCDGALYENACEAAAEGVSPSKAPTTDCNAERVACSDAPGAAECFLETQFCETFGGEVPQCRDLATNSGAACDELTCACVAPIYSESCTCSVNEAGFVSVECG